MDGVESKLGGVELELSGVELDGVSWMGMLIKGPYWPSKTA